MTHVILAVFALAAFQISLLGAFLLQAVAEASGMDSAIDALTEALASGNVVLAVVAGVFVALYVTLVVLRALGKQIPAALEKIVDPVVRIALGVTRKVSAKKPDPEKSQGLASVVSIRKDGDEK